tara:strand:+ start:2992 stop:3411 length:420 start_codon:yes stop_codon:yes gene_type:complete
MMTKRISTILLAALLLTACGSSGKPQSFIDQPGPLQSEYIELADELLQSSEDVNGVPLVQRNFIEGCMSAGLSEDGDIIALANSCGCSYKELVKFVREVTISDLEAFKAFEAFDNKLKEDDGFANLDSRVKDIFTSCQS